MLDSTRFGSLLVLVCAGVFLSANQVMEKVARGQTGDIREGQPSPPPVTGGPATLTQDRMGARKLDAIRDYIKTQSWAEVTRALQNLLDESVSIMETMDAVLAQVARH